MKTFNDTILFNDQLIDFNGNDVIIVLSGINNIVPLFIRIVNRRPGLTLITSSKKPRII